MKKKSIKNNKLTIYNKWQCKLSLDKALLGLNLLHKKPTNLDQPNFSAITRESTPYFIKANSTYKKFVKSFYSHPLVEKEDIIKHQLTLDLEADSESIPENLYKDLELASFIMQVTYSIVLIQIQRNNACLLELVEKLSTRWSVPVGINGYFTPGNSQTLQKHFDNHEVFILQIHGTKKWQVFDADPKCRGKQKIIIEKILNPGDMLYIPMGYYHQAVSGDATSFHMTFGLHIFADNIVKDWLKRHFKILDKKYSPKHMRSLNYLYFFYRYPKNYTDSPFLVFENIKEKKLVIFTENNEIHLDKIYKKELISLMAKKEIKSETSSKEILRLKKFFLKEKIL